MLSDEEREKLEIEKHKLLYIELPNIVHKILTISNSPIVYSKKLFEADIEEIIKVTNTECQSVLAYRNSSKLSQV